jgi:hypothetical protein
LFLDLLTDNQQYAGDEYDDRDVRGVVMLSMFGAELNNHKRT